MERSKGFQLLALTGVALLAAGAVTPARAQDPDDAQRGVARISLMNGEVSVRRGDSTDWVAGVINAPLLTEDRIATGQNSRAEVQFDAANLLRIGGNAEIRLTQLESGRYQMELARGTVTYRVLTGSTVNVEVDTPSVSVRPSKVGTYRISVNEAGESQVTARVGDVEVFTPRGSQWVYAGQTMMARGSTADPEFQIVSAIALDDWDRWNESRDAAFTRSVSAQYVPPGVYGTEQLDQSGTWANVAPYGYVWEPTVAVGWAPYQNGRWVWEDWYGWTWVSYDPWGWAPYHYGRWFWSSNRWCWYPGALGYRHYWSPALVGWFGFGHGVGIGFGFGNVGWVPLAPFEVFHPWWGRGYYGAGFNRGMNITNVNITNVYRNARVPNGIASVNAADFQSGRFNSIRRVSGTEVQTAGMIRGRMSIAPSSANLRFSDRQVANAPRTSGNTRFFTHQQPNGAQRTPFTQQQRSFEQPGRSAAIPSRTPAGSAASPAGQATSGFRGAQGQQAATPQNANAGNGGWRRFNEPAAQNGARPKEGSALHNTRPAEAPSANQNNSRSGNSWSRFGEPGSSQSAPRTVERSAPAQGSGNSGSGWNRFGSPGSSNSAPRQQQYSAPRSESRSSGSPSYNAPRNSAPAYSAPRSSAPSYSAPRSSGGGGGGSRPSGGGGHSSGGGGGHGHR